jgi:hypothetical protein
MGMEALTNCSIGPYKGQEMQDCEEGDRSRENEANKIYPERHCDVVWIKRIIMKGRNK